MKEYQKRIEDEIFKIINSKFLVDVSIYLVKRVSEERKDQYSGTSSKSYLKESCGNNGVDIIIAEPTTKEHYDEIAHVLASAYDAIDKAEKIVIHNESHPDWWTALNYKIQRTKNQKQTT